MKRVLVLAIVLCSSAPADAALTLKEIRTASDTMLVAYFKSTTINANEVNTAPLSAWKLNGQAVTAINRFVTEADACDHHVYLQVPTLVQGTSYTLQTPHGDTTFVFDDHKVFCESIKTNQNGMALSIASKIKHGTVLRKGWRILRLGHEREVVITVRGWHGHLEASRRSGKGRTRLGRLSAQIER